ncbi:RNAPII degradation factor [Entomophthora muscae]|uniref:RNAPII degradation factor n=1 Tax=Entomophthora muscae TaxID=34485 RepID=A0ACC2S1B4_9FUNG|nr:RNAPII degradation factor [Entomophthora muscae]
MSHRARAHRSYKPKSKEESDEIALLRATHTVNLRYLNELFPDWSDEDLLYTLQDTFGDLELTVARISEGFASQWGEVKNRKPKKDSPIATQSANSKNSAPRSQDDKKPRVVGTKPPRAPRSDRPSNKSSYRTNDQGTIASASESAGQGLNSTEDSGWNTENSKQGTGWDSLPQSNGNWADSAETKDNSDWGTTPADSRYGHKSSHPPKAPVQQNTWASRVAKSTPSTSVRDRKPRLNHSKSHEANHSDRHLTDKARGSVDSFPNLNNKHSSDSLIQNSDPKPAPTNTWAKIASLAAQPKPVTPKLAHPEPEPENSNWETPDFESTHPDTTEELVASEQPEEDSPHNGQSEVEADKPALEAPDTPKAANEVDASQLKKPSGEPHHLSHSSGVVIPGTMAAKMGEISKKFAKMETSDLDSAISEQALEGSLPQQSATKLPPPGIPIASNGLRSARPLAASKPSFVPSSFTNGTTELETTSAAQEAAPEPASESLVAETATQAHVSPAPEQRNGPAAPAAAQPAKAATAAQPHAHEPAQHGHQNYYTQGFAHSQGAPVHQPPMHPQMMHQHQAQNSYMPYYPQYPYAPGHYNPYQGNNYTLQFAQKSLGGYEDNANFGNIAPGAAPTLPQDSGSSTANHTYEKSGHGKHKNYDAASDTGAAPHPGAPVGYGGFGYAGVPSYQTPGGPADGPIYYPHPYYTQPGHQHMFPGYPGAPGLQHLPPHLQQQHAGYSNPHPLQQQHQGHQPNPPAAVSSIPAIPSPLPTPPPPATFQSQHAVPELE